MAVLLALATVALYWPATGNDFVNFDDNQYVFNNPHVLGGLTAENIGWAFRTGYAANWHPVTWLSHMLDGEMYRLQPWGHHLTSVLLHALNAALVFLWLRQMTGAVWRSLFVAAIFAAHPLRVESVAWVAERKDVLSCFFGLLTLIFYSRYAKARGMMEKARSRRSRSAVFDYAAALVFFALGLMSKPMLVTWPFLLLLMDYWPLRRLEPSESRTWPATILRSLIEKVPFFILAAAAGIVTFLVQQQTGAMIGVERLPGSARVENALISYCRYLGKLVWPTNLAIIYPHPGHWPLGEALLAGGLLLAVSIVFVTQRRRHPYLLIGWLWFIGTLVPVIGFVQVGNQSMADRYTYIPALGIFILVTWGLCEVAKNWRHGVETLAVAATTALVPCLFLTRQQLGYWADTEALFRHAVEVTQNNYVAYNDLGEALARKGRFDGAIEAYQEVVRLKPDYALAHFGLGYSFASKGQIDDAIREYKEAARLKPDYLDAHNNLGNLLGQKGQTDEAMKEFQTVIQLRPDFSFAHYGLAIALYQKGRIGEATREFGETIRIKPDYPDAYNGLGYMLLRQGQVDDAIRDFQQALALNPNYGEAKANLAEALAAKDNAGSRSPVPSKP